MRRLNPDHGKKSDCVLASICSICPELSYFKVTRKYKPIWSSLLKKIKKYAPWALNRLIKMEAKVSRGPNRQINLIGKGILIFRRKSGARHAVAYENGRVFDSKDGVIHRSLRPIYRKGWRRLEAKIPMTRR